MDAKNNASIREGRIITSLKRGITSSEGALGRAVDLLFIVLGYVFALKHTYFGAYPLGLSLAAVLPSRVWLSFLGIALGYISLGRHGVVYALSALVVVLLRILISPERRISSDSSGMHDSGAAFSERLLMRAGVSAIGGFIVFCYIAFTRGLNMASALHGAIMIFGSPVLVIAFYPFFSGLCRTPGAFGLPIRNTSKSKTSGVDISLLVSVLSGLFFVFSVSYSLSELRIFGIDIWLIFSVSVMLLTAKRLGTPYAMAVAFVSGLPSSLVYSVSLSLAGAAVGVLISLGFVFAPFIGGIAMVGFATYSQGLTGLLSTLPEYAIASVLMLPVMKRVSSDGQSDTVGPKEESPSGVTVDERCEDMVGTMALRYQSEERFYYVTLEEGLRKIWGLFKKSEGFRDAGLSLPVMNAFLRFAGQMNDELRTLDTELTDKLSSVAEAVGLKCGVLRVFGGRRKYIILAAEDPEGRIFSTDAVGLKIEEACGLRFSKVEYFRKGDLGVVTYRICEKYYLESQTLSKAGGAFEVSGDSVCIFDTEDMYSYALICDGMGSGERARECSLFASEYLRILLSCSAEENGIFHGLNNALRAGEECSVAIDIFRLDRITGEGIFIKSGAAPSYIKRNGSLFRIRSATMPIGVLKNIDAEKIRSRVGSGDMIFMLSDGIVGSNEASVNDAKYDSGWEGGMDAPWLVDMLNSFSRDTRDMPSRIVDGAVKNNTHPDDMTVIVGCVKEIERN